MLLVATEDELSEVVALRLLREAHPNIEDIRPIGRKGNSYLRSKIPEFCRTAQRCWVLVFTDLDRAGCAATLVNDWLGPRAKPEKLILRVVDKEIESWLLADRVGLSQFLGISSSRIANRAHEQTDAKGYLVGLARSGKHDIRREICPGTGVRARQGPGYNRCLSKFVDGPWSVENAASESDSLARARRRIAEIRA